MGLGLGCRWWCMYIFSGWDGRRELPRARVCVCVAAQEFRIGADGPRRFWYIHLCVCELYIDS